MVSFKDIVTQICLGLIWFISAIFIVNSDYPFLIVPLFILVVYAKIQIKRRKKILPFVKDDFRKLGYELSAERPSKLSEIKFEFSIEPTINGVPLSRYKFVRRFYRIFKGKDKAGKTVLLNTIVTKKWSGENHIEIVKIKKPH